MSKDTMKMIANTMVMRSRFFSMMLVPVCVEYRELAIASETPVPLPEWSMMNAIRPIPDITKAMMASITSGLTVARSLR